MLKNYLHNERGYTLLIALLGISVIMAIGLSILATTGTTKTAVEKEDKDQSAYYIAEAGLNLKKEELAKVETLFNNFQTQYLANENPEKMTSAEFINRFKVYAATELSNATADTYYSSATSQCSDKTNCLKIFERPNALATVKTETTISNTNFSYKIVSTGSVDKQTRKVATTLAYSLKAEAYKEDRNSFSKYVIHATDTLTINKGNVTGALGFVSKPVGILNAKFPFGTDSADSFIKAPSGETYKGCKPTNMIICSNSYLNDAELKKDIVFKDTSLPEMPVFPHNEFPINTSSIWDEKIPGGAKSISNTILSGNYSVKMEDLNRLNNTIDIGNNEVNLYFPNNFSITNSGSSLTINGSGKVNIYTKKFELKNNNFINFTDNDVAIFAKNNFETFNSSSINTKKSLTINTLSLLMEGSSTIQANGNLNIFDLDLLSLDNSTKLSSSNNIKIKAKTISSKNSSSIVAKNAIDMFIQEKVNFNNNNKITIIDETKRANIYYTGTSQTLFENDFDNKVNFDSLYSGLIFKNSASLDGTIIVRNTIPTSGIIPNKDITFSHGTNNVKGPFYILAPYSNITVEQAKIKGSLIGKTVLIDQQASIEFVPKVTNSPSTPGTEVTTEAGIISSSFTNNSTGGSIEID